MWWEKPWTHCSIKSRRKKPTFARTRSPERLTFLKKYSEAVRVPGIRRQPPPRLRATLLKTELLRKERQHFGFKVHGNLSVVISFERFKMMRYTGIRECLVHVPIRLKQVILSSHVHFDGGHS